MAAAFRPGSTASSFARCRIDPAVRFALITALPLSALAGVIPHTQTLLFGPALDLQFIGQPTDAQIAVDILRAMLVQLILDTTVLLALGLPFVSLVRSYGGPEGDRAALATLLYRAWLIPGGALVNYLALWVLPESEFTFGLFLMVLIVFQVLLVYAMWSTSRTVCEISAPLSVVIVSVSCVLAIVVLMVVGPVVVKLFGLAQPGVPGTGTPVESMGNESA
jgi:hypothetical protein